MVEKHGRGRRGQDGWLQPGLFDQEAAVVELRVGMVGDSGLYLFELTAYSEPGHTLVGMRSWPAVQLKRVPEVSTEVLSRMLEALEVIVAPF